MYVNVCVWAWAWVWVCRMCICVRYMFCTLSVEFVSWTYEECLFCRRQTMALYLYSKQTPSTWSLSLRQSSLSFFFDRFHMQALAHADKLIFTYTDARARNTLVHTLCSIRHSFISFRFVYSSFNHLIICVDSRLTGRIKRENQCQWKQQTRSVYDLTLHDQHVYVTSFGLLCAFKKKFCCFFCCIAISFCYFIFINAVVFAISVHFIHFK